MKSVGLVQNFCPTKETNQMQNVALWKICCCKQSEKDAPR